MSVDSPAVTTALERPATPRGRRVLAPVLTIGGITLATVALRFRDPHQSHTWGVCPLYAATGVYCPGCGGLRAVNDLARGHLGAALSSNLVLTLAFPLVVGALLMWTADRWRGTERVYPRQVVLPTVVVFVTALLAFTVLRNVSAGAWLAP